MIEGNKTMTLPSRNDELSLDWSDNGGPFVYVCGKSGQNTLCLDWSFDGGPWVGKEYVNIDSILSKIKIAGQPYHFIRPERDTLIAQKLINDGLPVGSVSTTIANATTDLNTFMGDEDMFIMGGPFYDSSARSFHDYLLATAFTSVGIQHIYFCGPGGKTDSVLNSPDGYTPGQAPQLYVQTDGGETLYSLSYSNGNTTNYGFIATLTNSTDKKLIYVAGINISSTNACEFVLDNTDHYFDGVDGSIFLVTSVYPGQKDFTPSFDNTIITSLES